MTGKSVPTETLPAWAARVWLDLDDDGWSETERCAAGLVLCLECEHTQADMGAGVACEACGWGPLPRPRWTPGQARALLVRRDKVAAGLTDTWTWCLRTVARAGIEGLDASGWGRSPRALERRGLVVLDLRLGMRGVAHTTPAGRAVMCSPLFPGAPQARGRGTVNQENES